MSAPIGPVVTGCVHRVRGVGVVVIEPGVVAGTYTPPLATRRCPAIPYTMPSAGAAVVEGPSKRAVSICVSRPPGWRLTVRLLVMTNRSGSPPSHRRAVVTAPVVCWWVGCGWRAYPTQTPA